MLDCRTAIQSAEKRIDIDVRARSIVVKNRIQGALAKALRSEMVPGQKLSDRILPVTCNACCLVQFGGSVAAATVRKISLVPDEVSPAPL